MAILRPSFTALLVPRHAFFTADQRERSRDHYGVSLVEEDVFSVTVDEVLPAQMPGFMVWVLEKAEQIPQLTDMLFVEVWFVFCDLVLEWFTAIN